MFIPQMEPWFGQEESDSVAEYMREGGWMTEFKRTALFEKMITDFTGAQHCIVVNNGTISLTLAAMACDIGPGDEVIVPNYTMIATPNSIYMLGAKPVFVDVEPDTLCMDLELAEKAITSKTKAIMLVSANGRYPNSGIINFEKLADRYGLSLIEDAAQSLGSFYPDGRHMGLAGKIGSFSFSAPKIISTGQGGALITNDDAMAKRLRKLKDFGRSGGGNDIHDEIGFNFKFTELQACLGVEQMKKLPWRIERKKEILKRYWHNLEDVKQVKFFAQDLKCTTPWFIDMLVDQKLELSAFLKENGVGSRVMYPPINEQACYQVSGDFPISKQVGEEGLWLPSAGQLKDEQIDHICRLIKQFFNKI